MKLASVTVLIIAVVWLLAWALFGFNPWNEFRKYEEGVWYPSPDGRERRWVWKSKGSSPETHEQWKEWEYRGIPK